MLPWRAVLWSFAKLGQRNDALLEAAAAHAVRTMPKFQPQSVVCCWPLVSSSHTMHAAPLRQPETTVRALTACVYVLQELAHGWLVAPG